MKNRFLPLSIIFIFLIIFIIFYKGLQNTNIYTPEVIIDNKIPSFSAKLFYSNKVTNSSEIFEPNKFYLLNIWSSWCVPCKHEHPFLIELKKDNNVEVIGVNYKDTKVNANKFLDELGNPYDQIIFDKDGTIGIEWGAFGVPESFLIYNRNIVKKYIGPLNNKSTKEIKLKIK
jgi:cytochrome c biogenesis protein CcmG/thiol:disulfide interchange protein DsbE|tara:strand:+ start:76 stop:594 length:519 start_codon:yes stop_codon:yes gene_type:complete